PRRLGKNAAHRLAQKALRHPVANLHRSRHAEHEFDQPMIEERVEMFETEEGGMSVLRSQAARRGLAKDVLICPVLEPARERVVERGREIREVEAGGIERLVIPRKTRAIGP